MCFAWPEHSGYLLLLIPLAVLLGYGFMRQIEARELLAGEAAGSDFCRKRLFFSCMLQFSGIALLLLALTGPQCCRGTRVMLRKGADVVFLLDVSSSMLAADVSPDRLELARHAALRISSLVPEGRKALLLFAGAPLVQCPLTSDRDAFEALLGMASPALVEEQGTAFGAALDQALKLAAVPASRGGDGTPGEEKIMVLISDGEDHEGGVAAAAEKLRRNGISLFVLGAGSRGDALVPDFLHPGEMKRDEAGNAVKTRFTPRTLQQLARESGGMYADAAGGERVYGLVAERINRIVERSRLVPVPSGGYPLYHYLLGAGMGLLMAERFLRGKKDPQGR